MERPGRYPTDVDTRFNDTSRVSARALSFDPAAGVWWATTDVPKGAT